MSFDVYLVSFADGKPSGVAHSLVRDAFGEHVEWEDEEEGWTHYIRERDRCSISLGPLKSDPSLVSCVCINRPVKDERFWDALHQIMKTTNMAFFFPGGAGPLIADDAAACHLPPDLGTPILVRSGQEIVEQIRKS